MTSKGYQCKLRLFTKLSRLSEEMAALSAEQLLDDEQALARLQNLVEQRAEVMAEIDRLPPGGPMGENLPPWMRRQKIICAVKSRPPRNKMKLSKTLSRQSWTV